MTSVRLVVRPPFSHKRNSVLVPVRVVVVGKAWVLPVLTVPESVPQVRRARVRRLAAAAHKYFVLLNRAVKKSVVPWALAMTQR